ncbi:hypothetical protein [Halorubrum sp. 2020YC2]|uniref:hypothetical protein n=1 Tax=Halorubrum sp. 2020YC2 TaxID=2836432 RepID=UPI001BEB2124|nr:hypothetical protein [Halorubrum sp. 2020YC2]QWC18112.1 hypothetical protein KI388_07955 [Halorubrum sp. 2020YC2]
MNQSKSQTGTTHIVSGVLGGALGITVGLGIATTVSQMTEIPTLVSVLGSSVIAPGVIAIVGCISTASFSIWRQRKKKESKRGYTGNFKLFHCCRGSPLSVNTLMGQNQLKIGGSDSSLPIRGHEPLAHLDTLFTKLMDHYTEAHQK